MAGARTLTMETMEGIGLVTINVPRSNAATAETWDNLTDGLRQFDQDPDVKVVVITGAGHHAFITDPDAAAMDEQTTHNAAAEAALDALAAFGKPVIARVRGECAGAGLLLTLLCDVIVAAEDSAFSLPGARWGAAYPPRRVDLLVGLIGPQQARRMLFTGERIEAREALRIGLVTIVTPDAELSDTVVDLAEAISDNAPLAVRAAKQMVANPGDDTRKQLVETCLRSDDYAAGIAAIKANRPANFRGR